jgi:release factor glutamine methyltransferase
MPQDAPWTVGRLLQWTADYLKRHNADSPRLDAEVLLAAALGCQRIDLYTTFEDQPSEPVRTAFRDLVRRRAEGTPVAYLVGKREFYSLSFRVTPDVLIPRPETELLVVTLLDRGQQRPEGQPVTVCDVGTGSGVIAVCAAKRMPGSRITAVDLSPAALEIARDNAQRHGVAEGIDFIQSDLLAAVPAERRFDFVVSNPPYVSAAEWEALSPDVRNYEPRLALVAGPLGTEIIARLIPQAAERLNPGGHLLLEISPMIEAAARALLEADPRLQLAPTIKDLARLPRVLTAVRR